MKKGWTTGRIGDVCDLATGGTPSRNRPEYFGGEIRWLVSGDINKGEIFDCAGRITKAGMDSCNAKFLPVPSVMIALNGQGRTRGTVALLRTQATCNQSMVSITPKASSGLLPEFLFANLQGRYEELRRLTSDDDKDRRGLNMGLIRTIEIPIAPLPEQQRIVALLDKAFAGLAIARANTEKNLQNARALFESHLQSVLANREKRWPIFRIGDLTDLVTKGTTPTSIGHTFTTEGVNFLKVESISEAGHFIEEKFAHISPNCHKVLGRSQLQAGDILFSIAGALGRTAITTEHILPANTNQALAIIRLKDSADVLPQFVLEALKSGLVLDQVDNFGAGAAQQNLSLAQIRELQIALPKMSEQKAIVRELGGIRTESVRLADLYAQKIDALAELKSSLLHQAFAGKLH